MAHINRYIFTWVLYLYEYKVIDNDLVGVKVAKNRAEVSQAKAVIAVSKAEDAKPITPGLTIFLNLTLTLEFFFI